MASFARLTGRAFNVALWLILLAFLVLLGLSRVSPLEVLIVRSGSMEPTIVSGGIIVVDRDAQVPQVGAIATFRDPDGTIVTHRVVGIDGRRLVTKGDANEANDAVHRPLATVYGTVVLSLPLVGYVLHLLQQPPAFLILLLGTGGLLVVDAIRTIASELSGMRRDQDPADAP